MAEPDERGIDLAILAFIGAHLAGEPEKAVPNAEAMLKMFGFTRKDHPHAR